MDFKVNKKAYNHSIELENENLRKIILKRIRHHFMMPYFINSLIVEQNLESSSGFFINLSLKPKLISI